MRLWISTAIATAATLAACADLVGPAPEGQGGTAASTAIASNALTASAVSADGASSTSTSTSQPVSASASSGGQSCVVAQGALANRHASRIAVGGRHACAVRPTENGSVLTCWGTNDTDQFAGACSSMGCSPVDIDLSPVFGTSRPRSVTAGDGYTCVVAEDDTLACFGQSLFGGMGANPLPNGFALPAVEGVDYAVARGDTTCAVTLGARDLICFGRNDRRQIDSSTFNAQSPVLVANTVVDAAVGGSFVMWSAGAQFYARGQSDSSVLAQTACDTVVADEVLLGQCALAGTSQVVAGKNFACYADLATTCWGDIGFSTPGCSSFGCSEPGCTCASTFEATTRMAAGAEHLCFIQEGSNATARARCVGAVTAAAQSIDVPLSFAPVDVAVSETVSCVIGPCGEVACWGDGSYGQLGIGVATSSVPVTVIP